MPPEAASAQQLSQGGSSILPALISAGGGAISTAYNLTESKRQRRFQREMSDTKHQREIRDLRKAGLNPILSATKGMGGAAPSGAAATTQNALASAGELLSKKGILGATENNLNANSAKAIEDKNTSYELGRVHSAKSYGQRIQNIKDAKTLPIHEKGADFILDFGKSYSETGEEAKKFHQKLNKKIKKFRKKTVKSIKSRFKKFKIGKTKHKTFQRTR